MCGGKTPQFAGETQAQGYQTPHISEANPDGSYTAVIQPKPQTLGLQAAAANAGRAALQPGLNRQPIAVPLPPAGALPSGPGMPPPRVPRLRVTPKAVFAPQANGFVYAAFQGNPRSFAGETRAQGFDVLHISWPGPGKVFTAVVRPRAEMRRAAGLIEHNRADSEAKKFTLSRGAASPKSLEERQVENARLFRDRPHRKHPLSSIFQSPEIDAFSFARRKAALLGEMAHDDGRLPQCPMLSLDPSTIGTCGEYVDGKVFVHPAASFPIVTTLHEMGHHLAKHVFSEAEINRLGYLCMRTERGQKLRENFDEAESDDAKHYAAYLIRNEEFFCRAYAQWVAVRTGDVEVIQELNKILRSPTFNLYQWTPREFEPIMKEFDKAFQTIGYL